MKVRILSIGIMVAMLSIPAVYAQKVVLQGSQIIIDASGILHTKTPKARTTTATNRSTCTQDETDIASTASNAKVYYKFEVSKVNNASLIKWREAIDLCANLTHNGSSGWRLPTYRELMLIAILQPELLKVGFDPIDTISGKLVRYWGSTEWDSADACTLMYEPQHEAISVENGIYKEGNANFETRVRCIRDIK